VEVVDLGNKGMVLDKLLLLLLTLNLDLLSSLIYRLHILIVSFNSIAEVHEEAIS